MRELGKYDSQEMYFSARVKKPCKFGNKLLLDNVQAVTGDSQDNHVWVSLSKRLKGLDNGDCITFRGTVEEYIRYSDMSKDYTIKMIREVKKI